MRCIDTWPAVYFGCNETKAVGRMAAIEARELRKVYKVPAPGRGIGGAVRRLFSGDGTLVEAIRGIDLSIERGEAVAYLGANGSGKSTTVKMLAGLLQPSSGYLRVNGREPFAERQEHVRDIAVVFGHRTQLWWDLPVLESFCLLQRIYRIPEESYSDQLARFEELLDLGPLLSIPVRNLSLGQRMRCELAGALLHRPSMIFLDEPTIGLDVEAKHAIAELIRYVNREDRTTILLTSHDLGDIEVMCNRMIIIEAGQVVHDGDAQSVKRLFARQSTLVLRLRSPHDGAITGRGPEGVSIRVVGPHEVHAVFDRVEQPATRVIAHCLEAYDVADLELRDPTIEDAIRSLYSNGSNPAREAAEGAAAHIR